jgi:hypothetical protein
MDKFSEMFNKRSAQHREELAKFHNPVPKPREEAPNSIFLNRNKTPAVAEGTVRDKVETHVG